MRILALVLGLVLAMQVGPAAAADDTGYTVFFDRGRDEVTPQAMATLRDVAANYKARPDRVLVIAGHTEPAGAEADNVALSRRRAGNVVDALASLGVPDGVMTTESFGESRPMEGTSGDSPMNNRVEITFAASSGW